MVLRRPPSTPRLPLAPRFTLRRSPIQGSKFDVRCWMFDVRSAFRTLHWPPLAPRPSPSALIPFTQTPPSGKTAPDEGKRFIRGEDPFGYHPKMGGYPDLLLPAVAVDCSPSHGFRFELQYCGHYEHICPALEWSDPQRPIARLVDSDRRPVPGFISMRRLFGPNYQPALDAAKAFSLHSWPHGRGPSEAGRYAADHVFCK
jgi:hypothetical protein